ncbi:hypothetical protein lbkm_0062 [Lachnospiraceae bacterium KM106-2]|nr:hypothetical protein lbkm_0062 [Lachnospiraceae bacterium KM106-2]
MNSQKAETQLNLALDVSNEVREQTLDLDVGYIEDSNSWELIVKHSGSLDRIRTELGATVTELLNEYAIIVIRQDLIPRLEDYDEIEYIEKPKRLTFAVRDGVDVSCIRAVQNPPVNLTGEGVLVAIIDSGIDYSHPDFRNEDGTTRIEYIWDQTIQGTPPPGYNEGTLYTREQINQALQQRDIGSRLEIVPSTDLDGHGTHVAGIAVGNGRASQGVYRGVAFNSEIAVVKLGSSVGNSFPRTTQLMTAIDYVIRRAAQESQPVVINLSFGNSYGSHAGNSLLETYINEVANLWKNNIVIGSGNDGASSRHAVGVVRNDESVDTEFTVSPNEPSLNLQIWKNSYDFVDITIIAPNGNAVGPINAQLGSQRYQTGNTTVYLYFGEASPYSILQEIYIEFLPIGQFIDEGIWTIRLTGRRIVEGNFNMWLPSGGVLNVDTKFVNPSIDTTLTIPSTASRAITVGAYNGDDDNLAFFSGRGYTTLNQVKPDLVAPGVEITSCAPNGGYTTMSGTSQATPFVSGSCALLMQYGIVQNNDPYLYGEKTKSYLITTARELQVYQQYPNRALGFGALCLRRV